MIPFDFVAPEGPPECGWEPFMMWMREQGLDPSATRSIHIIGEGLAAVEVYLLDANSERYAIGDEAATETFTASLSCPPPLHPARGAVR